LLSEQDLIDLPISTGISTMSLQELKSKTSIYHFKNKSDLIFKGDVVNGAYLVIRGRLRIYNINPEGNQKSIYYVQEGEACLLAMNCVFSDLLYPAWVSTDSKECTVLMIPGKLYKKLNESEKIIREFTFDTLSKRIFDLMSRLEEVSTLSLEQRLASFLVTRSNSEHTLEITHQEIAHHLGTAREVISRMLKSFEKQGSLELTRGKIILNSPQKLAKHEFK